MWCVYDNARCGFPEMCLRIVELLFFVCVDKVCRVSIIKAGKHVKILWNNKVTIANDRLGVVAILFAC